MSNKFSDTLDPIKEVAKPLGHTPEHKEEGAVDTIICSCGWKSKEYFDNPWFAWEEWIDHVKPFIKAVEKKQPTIILPDGCL